MYRNNKRKVKNSKLGKRPKINLDSLTPSTKPLREALDLVKKHSFIMTPFQFKILCLYREKDVRDIVKEDGISQASVYAVFNSLREKRRKARMYLNLMRKLSRDNRFFGVLTIKPTFEEKKIQEENEREEAIE